MTINKVFNSRKATITCLILIVRRKADIAHIILRYLLLIVLEFNMIFDE